MEWKKNIDTNLGITIILVFAALFTIVDFYVIGSELDGYPFNDLSDEVVIEDKDTVVEDKDVVDVEDSVLVYDHYTKDESGHYVLTGIVDRYYKYNAFEYHVIVKGNSVFVNDVEVFRCGSVDITSVYLIKDIIAILYGNNHLVFVDMNGNVLKDIENTYNYSVVGVEISTEIDNYTARDDEIYEYHNYDKVSFSYLGDGKFSDFNVIGKGSAVGVTPDTCIDSKERCLLYDKNGVKVESSWDDDRDNWGAVVSVNGKPIKLDGYRIHEIKFTNDKYLYISGSSGTGNGRPAFFLIADLDANVISTIDWDSLSGVHMYNYSTSFENGKITYDAVQEGSYVEYACKRMLEIEEGPLVIKSYDDAVYVKNEYQYIGDGKVSRINRIEKTFGNYMKELTGYENCQDAINNIDSWKSKDSVYTFYGVK